MEALARNASAFRDLHARLIFVQQLPTNTGKQRCPVPFKEYTSRSVCPHRNGSHTIWIVSQVAIQKSKAMKVTKNIGMLLLAVYLIIDGLLGFGVNFGPAIFLLYLVALAAGIFILIGK
jgi:hypothetical protein